MGVLNDSAMDYIADSAKGKIYENTKSSMNLAANISSFTLGASVELPPGVYVIAGRLSFGSTSGSASAINVALGTSASNIYSESEQRIYQTASWWTVTCTTAIVSLKTTTKVYVMGACTLARSGCSSYIKAIKIWGGS